MSLTSRARRAARRRYGRRRIELFRQTFAERTVVDIGGTSDFWHGISGSVTIANVRRCDGTAVVASGCGLPLRDHAFGVAHSNSVIEHVGDYDDQRRFADEMRRVGLGVWCQTPNRWFPVEPHFIAPFIHWLPRRRLKPWIVRWFSLHGWADRPGPRDARASIECIRLLGRREFAALFPDCRIERERTFGLTKSFIAIREAPLMRDIGVFPDGNLQGIGARS